MLLKSPSAHVHGLQGANATLQPLLPCQGWPGSPYPPTPLSVLSMQNGFICSPFSPRSPQRQAAAECQESQLRYNLSPWAASPAEIYRLCLSQGPCRLNYRSASRLDWGSNLPAFAEMPRGRATGPARPGTSESLGPSQPPRLGHVRKLRPEMGRHTQSSHQGKWAQCEV